MRMVLVLILAGLHHKICIPSIIPVPALESMSIIAKLRGGSGDNLGDFFLQLDRPDCRLIRNNGTLLQYVFPNFPVMYHNCQRLQIQVQPRFTKPPPRSRVRRHLRPAKAGSTPPQRRRCPPCLAAAALSSPAAARTVPTPPSRPPPAGTPRRASGAPSRRSAPAAVAASSHCSADASTFAAVRRPCARSESHGNETHAALPRARARGVLGHALAGSVYPLPFSPPPSPNFALPSPRW